MFPLPFALIALVLVILYVPGQVNESTAPVDNLGGIFSVVLVTALILAINFAPAPGGGTLAMGTAAVAVAAAVAFVLRQRRAANSLYDLHIAGRRVFWVAAVGGMIVFGALMGAGVGLFGTPASHSLTASVPVDRVGMASATADLQRDLGGAIMQSVFGALLTAGYAAAVAKAIAAAPDKAQITSSVQNQLEKSFSSAAAVAQQYPQYASAITAGAKSAFLQGANWAYAVGIVATLIGIALVLFLFPGKGKSRNCSPSTRRRTPGR